MLRYLFWRLLALFALLAGLMLLGWFLDGGPGRLLRGHAEPPLTLSVLVAALGHLLRRLGHAVGATVGAYATAIGALAASALPVALTRVIARRRRRYVRLQIDVYRNDHAGGEEVAALFATLHKRLLRRWWRRLFLGQPSLALEIHHSETPRSAWLALTCPHGRERMVEAALQAAYPNCRLRPLERRLDAPAAVLRLKKQGPFIKRVKALDELTHRANPPVNGLLTVMGACGEPAFVQLALTPTPGVFEAYAKHLFTRREAHLSRARREHLVMRDRSMVNDAELRGGLTLQHEPLFFADIRVVARRPGVCERIASELRAEGAENRLVERGTALRQGVLGLYTRRVLRGEGNPLPSFHRGVYAPGELAAMWQLPSVDYLTVALARSGLPLAPASPAVERPMRGLGMLRDCHGPVSIHEQMRRQNTAVPGTVEQGKSSFLVATVVEDLRRERCAVIVLDPKGDAAEAALSAVPVDRTCTLLDLAHPTCGFNPMAVDAPADVIADYVVTALKGLFTDADIRASSDRYLRNAIIAVLAYDAASTLWDAARLLSVGEEGYAYRSRVGGRVRELPELKEISEFFTAELSAQLADARSTTTAKLDAPVNKLARLLNSPSIKRVLLNDTLRVDFDQLIAGAEVLIVKGALGGMGAGNTSVLMQLLVGMLDAALARQQDLVPAVDRVAVALKVDEAPLVINRGFAETMALKRSAGLETVACWQTDAQWTEREVRDQLDALFAHRVYFATASTRDAREAVGLTMAEFSDTVRPGVDRLSSLGRPDVRLHLPRHHAIASWVTPEGRQAPFVAETVPLSIDRERMALHAARQRERGGRHLGDLRQPHWDHRAGVKRSAGATDVASNGQGPTPSNGRGSSPGESPRAWPGAWVGQPAESDGAQRAELPPLAAESYRELVELDGAHTARWARELSPPHVIELDELDLRMLELIAAMQHVLTSQLHRHCNPERASTTTQRRLKRLSDGGLVRRFQFHRRDGGGIPMCYVITPAGVRALAEHGRRVTAEEREAERPRERPTGTGRPGTAVRGDAALRQARHQVHVTGWAFALAAALGDERTLLRGPALSLLSPAKDAGGEHGAALSLNDLRLPGGRTPHEFLRSDGSGERVPVERFETVRPDATVVLAAPAANRPAIDVLVELDDRVGAGAPARKLERYDHFLAGWSAHTRRYGQRREASASVVFVCRDRARARACARSADSVLCACRAYAGEYPFEWEYPGRERIAFVAERDAHEGLTRAFGVPRLPPAVRVRAAHGDPRAGEATAEARHIGAGPHR